MEQTQLDLYAQKRKPKHTMETTYASVGTKRERKLPPDQFYAMPTFFFSAKNDFTTVK